MKRFAVFHCFFLALFFVLYLFSHNIEVASFHEAIFSLVAVLVFTLLFLISAKLIFRDKLKAGILTTFLLILFFSYGHIYNVLFSQGLKHLHHRYLLLVWAGFFTGGFFYIIKARKNLNSLNNFLNVVSFLLLIYVLAYIGIYKFVTRDFWLGGDKGAQDNQAYSRKIDSRPDIFYIILDGYPNSAILKKLYGFDNQDLIGYLTKKGFYIVPQGRSNYAMTFLSLTSSLNMQYINNLSNVIGENSKDRSIPYKMMEDNAVAKFLKLQGYKFINISSGWGPTDNMQDADLNFRKTKLDEFTKLLISTTILNPLVGGVIAENDKTVRLLYLVSLLPKLNKIKGPKFVLAHIITKSLPQNFELQRRVRGDGVFSVSEKKLLAAKYFIFVNSNIKKMVDYLLLKSEIPPIIILQADHGPREMSFAQSGILQWENLTDAMLSEGMGIFNAYYLPAKGKDRLYSSITPVNTFRLIFSFYFGADYKMLDDQCYYSTKDFPYRFLKATDRVKFD